jgi:hypothetical protein
MKARAAGLAGASARQASAMRPRSAGRVSGMARTSPGWARVTDSGSRAGSAMSFYQLAGTVAYSIASALSATTLVLSIPRGHHLPTDAGYSTAALTSTIVLVAALIASLAFALPAAVATVRRPSGAAPARRAGG